MSIVTRPILLGVLAAVLGPPAVAAPGAALDAALAAWAKTDAVPAHATAFTDLNDDGIADAVVLITGRAFCGSGGCTLVVLKGTRQGFDLVSACSVSREPLSVAAERRHGWHSLLVSLSGGGATPGLALLRFNGRKYPSNPSRVARASPQAIAASTPLVLERGP